MSLCTKNLLDDLINLNLSWNQDSCLHNRIIIIKAINNLPSVSNNRQISHLIKIIKSPSINSDWLWGESIKSQGTFLNTCIVDTMTNQPRTSHDLRNSQTPLRFEFTHKFFTLLLYPLSIQFRSTHSITQTLLILIMITILKLNLLRLIKIGFLMNWILYFI